MNDLLKKKSSLFFFGLILFGLIESVVYKSTLGVAFLLFFGLIFGLMMSFKWFHKKYNKKWIKVFYILSKIGFVALCGLSLLILILVARPQFTCQNIPPEAKKAEYVIVLGAGLKDGNRLSYSLWTRLNKAIEVFEVNPNIKIVVSGGQGKDEELSEAQAMENYLVQKEIPKDRIIQENQSQSTYENLVFSKKKMEDDWEMLEPSTETLQHANTINSTRAVLQTGPAPNIIIVSSDFHLFRLQFLARDLGMEPIGVCSSTYFTLKTNYMIREIPAVVNEVLRNVFR